MACALSHLVGLTDDLHEASFNLTALILVFPLKHKFCLDSS